MDVRNGGRRWGRSNEGSKGGTEKLEIETEETDYENKAGSKVTWIRGKNCCHLDSARFASLKSRSSILWVCFQQALTNQGAFCEQYQLSLKTTENLKMKMKRRWQLQPLIQLFQLNRLALTLQPKTKGDADGSSCSTSKWSCHYFATALDTNQMAWASKCVATTHSNSAQNPPKTPDEQLVCRSIHCTCK